MRTAAVPFFALCVFTLTVVCTAQRYRDRVIMFQSQVKTCRFDEYGICEKASNYPTDKMRNLMKKHYRLQQFLGNVIEPVVEVADRFGDDEIRTTFCNSTVRSSAPEVIKNTRDQERFIFNLGGDLVQTVTFEVCDEKEGGCPTYNNLYAGEKSKCEQRYNVIKLLACSDDTCSDLAYDTFKIPSTCVCVLYSDDAKFRN